MHVTLFDTSIFLRLFFTPLPQLLRFPFHIDTNTALGSTTASFSQLKLLPLRHLFRFRLYIHLKDVTSAYFFFPARQTVTFTTTATTASLHIR